jgi:glycosyltransferase involved in cell wall biosynthesis
MFQEVSSMSKILMISHDASRTGAPILLLNLTLLLKKEGLEVDFLLKNGGQLEEIFKSLGSTYTFYKKEEQGFFNKIRGFFFRRSGNSLDKINWKKYDYVLSNTITNGNILPLIRKHFKGPVISYIHELEMATNFFTNENDVKALIKNTDLFFVPSIAVKDFLVLKFQLSPKNVSLLHYYIPPISKLQQTMKDLLKENSSFFVGGAGTSDWRKSPDLFIQVAKRVFTKAPDANIKFIWKGALKTGVEIQRLMYDITKMELSNKVMFDEASPNMASFYSSIDLFLLTSREDPYPLVVLEAADLSVPTICFKNAGGAIEFIESSGGGRCVDYMDIEAMADTVLFYYKNEEVRKKAGSNAKEFLSKSHQNPSYIFKQFKSSLEDSFERYAPNE